MEFYPFLLFLVIGGAAIVHAKMPGGAGLNTRLSHCGPLSCMPVFGLVNGSGASPPRYLGNQVFVALLSTALLIKPTLIADDRGHLAVNRLASTLNQACRNFTCDFGPSECSMLTARTRA
jgi:hypothetical protein